LLILGDWFSSPYVKRIFIGPNGLRAGWRFAMFLALSIPTALGLDWLVTHVLHYQSSPGWNPRDFLVDGASTLSVAVFAAWLMSKLERRAFADYGLTRRGAFGRQFWLGLLWGLIPSIIIVVMIWALGGAAFHGLALHGRALFSSAVLWGLAFLLLGFGEEFLYRGYAQFTLSTGMGFWPAAALLSAVFGAVHYFGKPMESWRDGVSVALYGLFWCFTLRRTGSLWFAIGFHAMSDYADMVIFAEPNTGNHGQSLSGHLLNITYHGPDWLTGGPCGTEASALVFLILAALFLLFHRLYPPRIPTTTP
jgi:uncharacterized protein